jgi:hypothetical protein
MKRPVLEGRYVLTRFAEDLCSKDYWAVRAVDTEALARGWMCFGWKMAGQETVGWQNALNRLLFDLYQRAKFAIEAANHQRDLFGDPDIEKLNKTAAEAAEMVANIDDAEALLARKQAKGAAWWAEIGEAQWAAYYAGAGPRPSWPK